MSNLNKGPQAWCIPHGSSGWPELSESAFPIPPAWQFDAACGLEIQGSDPCAYPPVEIAWDSTKPFNNFCPGFLDPTTSALVGSLSL